MRALAILLVLTAVAHAGPPTPAQVAPAAAGVQTINGVAPDANGNIAGVATTSALAALAQTVPTPLGSVPPNPTPAGTPTAGATQYVPADAAVRRLARTPTATTDASGNFTAPWTTPMLGVPTSAVITPQSVATDANAYSCHFVSATTTSVTGHCNKVAPSNLLTLLNMVLALPPANATGLPVKLLVLEPAM